MNKVSVLVRPLDLVKCIAFAQSLQERSLVMVVFSAVDFRDVAFPTYRVDFNFLNGEHGSQYLDWLSHQKNMALN